MGLADLLSTITTKYHERERQKVTEFAGLVRKIADGESPRDADVLLALDRFDKQPTELQEAVEKLLARRKAAAAVKAGEGVEAQRVEVNRKADAAAMNYRVTVETAEAKYATALQPLKAKMADLDRLEREARAGTDLLRNTWENGEQALEAADLAKEMQTLRNRQGEVLTRAKAEENQADSTAVALKAVTTGPESRLLPAGSATRAEDLQVKLKDHAETAKALRGEAAAVEERIAAVVGRLGEIEAAKLVP